VRVVLANKYYYLKGGAERYLFDLQAELEAHGHEVAPFAMTDDQNRETPWSRFFVSPVQTEQVSFNWQGLRTVGRALYSFEAAGKFARLLDEFQPDLLHVHNIYRQISPSILPAARNRRIPTVMTVHDYALLAPNYSLYHDGEICEVTKPNHYYKAVRARCVKGSTAASLVAATENWLHDKLGLYRKSIDHYIAPSRFVKALMVDYGWPEEQITVLPYGIAADNFEPKYGGEYVLYVGRLVDSKGVASLVRAAAHLPEVPFRIVGTGPEAGRLKQLAAALGVKNLEFRGRKEGTDLAAEYRGARFVVVPSEWYEVFGLVVLEAYAYGNPVIATQIGGLPEVVRNGETGVLVSARRSQQLAEAIGELWARPELAEQLGRTAREWVETDFTPEQHWAGLQEVYLKAGANVSGQ
jgi:glycosyltransferase involved in cell wall biosynthesis